MANSNIKIRKANIDDIDKGLLDVFVEGYRFHQKGRPDVFANLNEEILKKDLISNFERLETIVILVDETIVGYLSYIIKNGHAKKLNVDQLVILEKYRNQGLGKKLMEEVKNIALKNNCVGLELNGWLFNDNAINMYEHIGFKKQRIIYEMEL